MYVPPFNAFLHDMNVSQEEFEKSTRVDISTKLLKFMMQILLTNASFNEEGYLGLNPDVAGSVKDGQIATARIHYIGYGFFESRNGATPEVDEGWYRRNYPDVDRAISDGKVGSATEHFLVRGAAEGRSPNPDALQDALQWKKAFSR